jgi:hypothetical protein
VLALVALMCGVGAALAGDLAGGQGASPGAEQKARTLSADPRAAARAEIVYFADPGHSAVRVMRGPGNPASPRSAPEPAAAPASAPAVSRTETVSFGPGEAERVMVVRGMAAPRVDAPPVNPAAGIRTEEISFADPLLPAVMVMRGIVLRAAISRDGVSRDGSAADLFGPANDGDLDRIAFAVDGVESRHGSDLRMWRQAFAAPQGPMQVSAAAALDVGGGDRFDLQQNRLLGRAYLARMFRRYGNWPDAVAAYNWGPGNLDLWIAGGRNAERRPPGVARYIDRVLRDALMQGGNRPIVAIK